MKKEKICKAATINYPLIVPLETSDVVISDEALVYAVTVQRQDGTKYLVLHPVEIDYENKLYSYPTKTSTTIEIEA